MKKIIYLIIILVGAGAWFGVNFAKNKPLLSNPFDDQDIRDRAAQAAGELAKDGLQEGQVILERKLNKR